VQQCSVNSKYYHHFGQFQTQRSEMWFCFDHHHVIRREISHSAGPERSTHEDWAKCPAYLFEIDFRCRKGSDCDLVGYDTVYSGRYFRGTW
jgi:hypothetical protein